MSEIGTLAGPQPCCMAVGRCRRLPPVLLHRRGGRREEVHLPKGRSCRAVQTPPVKLVSRASLVFDAVRCPAQYDTAVVTDVWKPLLPASVCSAVPMCWRASGPGACFNYYSPAHAD